MRVQPGRRRVWLVAIIAVALIGGILMLIITGQVRIYNPLGGGPLPGTGDPGNRRLNELSNDAMFARLPASVRLSNPIVKTPARYRQPVFDGGGWDSPSVVATFVGDQQSIATVYQFYAAQAVAAGWQTSHHGQLGYVDGWTKTYPDNATAWLNLYSFVDTPQGRTYELAGSITVIQ